MAKRSGRRSSYQMSKRLLRRWVMDHPLSESTISSPDSRWIISNTAPSPNCKKRQEKFKYSYCYIGIDDSYGEISMRNEEKRSGDGIYEYILYDNGDISVLSVRSVIVDSAWEKLDDFQLDLLDKARTALGLL
jgi:hypothetical protein